MKLLDKILHFYDEFSYSDSNDLTMTDYIDDQINDIDEVTFSKEEINYANSLVNKIEDKNKMNTLELLEKVTDAATFLYVKNNGDTVAPNILVSKLPNKQYYVSLNRYITPTDRFKKTIMHKATKSSLRDALLDIAKFLSKQNVVKTNPLEELGKLFDEPVPETLPPVAMNYDRFR